MDKFKQLAVHRLAEQPKYHRFTLQIALNRWNAVATRCAWQRSSTGVNTQCAVHLWKV
jgi:hypothetical protein